MWLTLPLLLSLAGVTALAGRVVGKLEGWARTDTFYCSFITATTVGYGDIRPAKPLSKLIAVFIALLGVTFTGILIAIAVHAATMALNPLDSALKLGY